MTRNKMKILGLTGEIAAGKSAVSNLLRKKNGYIIDADEISHQVVLKGEPAYYEILSAIPGRYLDEAGEIDRRRLGELVFSDSGYMRLLESAVHKHVINRISEEMEALRVSAGKYRFIVLDAPLLIESGQDKMCDCVWIVEASPEIRAKRLMNRNGLTEAQAQKRILARSLQPPPSCVIITNNEGLDALRKKVNKKLTEFLEI